MKDAKRRKEDRGSQRSAIAPWSAPPVGDKPNGILQSNRPSILGQSWVVQRPIQGRLNYCLIMWLRYVSPLVKQELDRIGMISSGFIYGDLDVSIGRICSAVVLMINLAACGPSITSSAKLQTCYQDKPVPFALL